MAGAAYVPVNTLVISCFPYVPVLAPSRSAMVSTDILPASIIRPRSSSTVISSLNVAARPFSTNANIPESLLSRTYACSA